jgi:hypothetical protein
MQHRINAYHPPEAVSFAAHLQSYFVAHLEIDDAHTYDIVVPA